MNFIFVSSLSSLKFWSLGCFLLVWQKRYFCLCLLAQKCRFHVEQLFLHTVHAVICLLFLLNEHFLGFFLFLTSLTLISQFYRFFLCSSVSYLIELVMLSEMGISIVLKKKSANIFLMKNIFHWYISVFVSVISEKNQRWSTVQEELVPSPDYFLSQFQILHLQDGMCITIPFREQKSFAPSLLERLGVHASKIIQTDLLAWTKGEYYLPFTVMFVHQSFLCIFCV